MSMIGERLVWIEEKLHGVLVRHAIKTLRITVGAIFLGFGVLKFFPGVSPAEDLSIRTIGLLTFGLIPWHVAIVAIAALECFIGICLLAKRWMRAAVWLLVVQFAGILAPLVLLTPRLFSGPHHAPTLEGQYVLKDIILVAAGMAIAAGTFRGGRLVRDEPGGTDAPAATSARQADEPDASHKLQIVLSAAAGERSVQDVCDEHDISESTYYAWRTATYHGAISALDEQTNSAGDTRKQPAR
ncbi:MAG: transposase [Solirubrobacterales bacterium]|nr:transposase [Solirubrobacterales bacterium]